MNSAFSFTRLGCVSNPEFQTHDCKRSAARCSRLFPQAFFTLLKLSVLTLLIWGASSVNAVSATITAATGGSAISSDTTSASGGTGAYTTLTGPVLTETAAGQIGTGTIILTAPSGFEFNTAANSVTGTVSGAGTKIGLQSGPVTPSTGGGAISANNTSSMTIGNNRDISQLAHDCRDTGGQLCPDWLARRASGRSFLS